MNLTIFSNSMNADRVFFRLGAAVLTVAMLFFTTAFAHASEISDIQDAYSAYKKKQTTRLLDLEQSMSDSVLAAYPAFLRLELAMAQTPVSINPDLASEIITFVQANSGSYVGNRMLSDWIKQFGQAGDWNTVNTYYPKVVNPDVELTCYAWQAKLSAGDTSFFKDALDLWAKQVKVPPACNPVFSALVRYNEISPLNAMERVYVLWTQNQDSAAKQLAMTLPAPYGLTAGQYATLLSKPATYLQLTEVESSVLRLYALLRIARTNPQSALSYWHQLDADNTFPIAERGLFWNMLGFEYGRRLFEEAPVWFNKAPEQAYRPLINEVTAWKARTGARHSDWALVLRATNEMNQNFLNTPAWLYWRGKAFNSMGRNAEAIALWNQIAARPEYYGILASEELNQPFTLPPVSKASKAVEDEISELPAMKRAMAFFEAGMRREALREWFWAIRDLDDAGLLAVAELMQQNDIIDRMISAADQTRTNHNYYYRYPMPHRREVQAASANEGLSEFWVYGLIRQESRFMKLARSHVGASGMMQIMPATAKWTAKRIGLTNFQPSQVNDLNTNLQLGTAYLSYVLGRFDNQAPLGFAAYNAGPGRPNQWRGVKTIDGPAYIESIPFTETRDYVKKVISNAYLYEKLATGNATSVKKVSGTIAPK